MTDPMLSEPTQRARRPRSASKMRSFDLLGHLQETWSAADRKKHIRRGLENYLATELQKGALSTRRAFPEGFQPRASHIALIEQEMHSSRPKARYIEVILTMPLFGGLKARDDVDFGREVRPYAGLRYHRYYLQPFHSLPGGWLNPLAATGNEAAMRALFRRSSRRGAEGLREAVAEALPSDAKRVYDIGCACGAQAARFVERMGLDGRVVCIDPSPFGLILGRRDFRDPRITWLHGFAEDLALPEGDADVVNFLFVLHEMPDAIKQKVVERAFSVLKPGGMLMVSEPPTWDLEHRSGGFYEPYRQQWSTWDMPEALRAAGFVEVRRQDLVHSDYMWTHFGTKPH